MCAHSVSLFSPAKVNLFFRVLHRRADGYHEIASLNQAISLGDTVIVSLAEEDKLLCDDPHIPCDGRNLAAKALEVFRKQTGYTFKVHIHLKKKIPIQAGLGGGSSNAATVLFALNALSSSPVEEHVLGEWAASFSSDAPFFFSSGSAYCSGRGEKLLSLPPLSLPGCWLAKPEVGLSTPLVYQHCLPDSCAQRDPVRYLESALAEKLTLFNDLEHPAFGLMPLLRALKEDLFSLGFSQVAMTGSGTAFVCLGSVQRPSLPGVAFFSVHPLQRAIGKWYEFPSI